MSTENGLDLEDLARRYDAQVLREYLLEQEESPDRPRRPTPPAAEDTADSRRHVWQEVFELRPRCIRRIRFLLAINFLAYWSVVGYCAYAHYLRVVEMGAMGTKALPPIEVCLLAFLALGTQATAEFAAALLLTRPVRAGDARSSGFQSLDGFAWLSGIGARLTVLLDALCLPLMWRGSSLLFLLSSSVFTFAIGIFVFLVQLRMLLGISCQGDHFSYDKPDLFFKGRDSNGMLDATPIAARPSVSRELVDSQDQLDLTRVDRPPPIGVIKAANLANISDLAMLHGVLSRLYVPINCRETQEFIVSLTSFSRCFCEDVVQCSVKAFFLLDIDINALVVVSLLVSAAQAVGSCFFASTSSMDLPPQEESELV